MVKYLNFTVKELTDELCRLQVERDRFDEKLEETPFDPLLIYQRKMIGIYISNIHDLYNRKHG